MRYTFKKYIIACVITASCLLPQLALAATTDLPCTPSQSPANPAVGTATPNNDLFDCINRLYKYALVISSIAGVFMIMLGGYLYIFSGGNDKKVSTAKSFITTSLLGIAVLLTGFLLLKQINPNLLVIKSITPTQIAKQDWVAWGEVAGLEVPTPQIIAQEKANGIATGTPAGFPNFKQTAAPWGSQQYGSCTPASESTVGTSACGPSSLANVIKYYQGKGQGIATAVDPGVIANLSAAKGYRVCGSGTSYGMFPALAQQWGLKAQNNVSWAAAEAALRAGTPVIAAMGPGAFTSGGHFITLYGIDSEGNVLISDSGPRNIIKAPIALVKSQQHFLTIITP